MNQSDFIVVRQHYKCGDKISPHFVDVLPKSLTLDKNFIAKRYDTSLNTLFREVKVVPFEDICTDKMRAVFSTRHTINETKEELFSRFKEQLKKTILDTWKPEKEHVILHSSGIDSRILSGIIKEIYLERGAGWLGKTVFLCSKREGKVFKDIMEYMGWDNWQVIREDVPTPYYYEPSLSDFSGAWERANGVSSIAVNLFWYPVMITLQNGLIDDIPQLYTSQWGNSMKILSSSISHTEQMKKIKWFYYSALCERPMFGNPVIHPMANLDVVKTVMQSSVLLKDKFRIQFLAWLDPKLAHFRNMNGNGDRHIKIADSILKKMVRDYKNSWYGKHIAPNAKPQKTTEFQGFYSRWTAASLCEHLLSNGHKTRIG